MLKMNIKNFFLFRTRKKKIATILNKNEQLGIILKRIPC